MSTTARTREPEFFDAVAAILHDAGGVALVTYVRRRIPSYLALTSADRLPSPTRPGEQLWEQQVRNIVCHRDSDGNPIKIGRFKYSKRRLALADSPQGELFNNDNQASD